MRARVGAPKMRCGHSLRHCAAVDVVPVGAALAVHDVGTLHQLPAQHVPRLLQHPLLAGVLTPVALGVLLRVGVPDGEPQPHQPKVLPRVPPRADEDEQEAEAVPPVATPGQQLPLQTEVGQLRQDDAPLLACVAALPTPQLRRPHEAVFEFVRAVGEGPPQPFGNAVVPPHHVLPLPDATQLTPLPKEPVLLP